MRLTRYIAAAAVFCGIGLEAGTLGAAGTQFSETVTVRGTQTSLVGGARSHVLTFSGPVGLPGIGLGAGSYVFKRQEPNVLLVFAADGRGPLAMVNTQPTMRTTSTTSYQVVLRRPGAAGAPPRIEAWFAAGEMYGQQLIYGSR